MRLEERIIYSTRIYDGKIVNLRVDTVELPDGRQAKREVIEHKGAIAVVPLLDTEEVVLVKQYRQPTGQVLIEIPAGTLDKNETPEECARRELIEEIGYAASKLTLMFSTYLSPGYSNEMLHTYLAENLNPARSEPEEDEFIEVMTVKLDDAVDMISAGEIKDAKTVCGILMAQRIINGRQGAEPREIC